ncbi:MAG TPA: hypothetical protein VLJ15_06950 [Gammaproteobacteria bacterium]|nr:hypothetical protein [Gammaproteobacteria bacterium]
MLSHYRRFLIPATKTVLSSAVKLPSKTVTYPTTLSASPLRQYSAMQTPNDKKNVSLKKHTPARELSSLTLGVVQGMWGVTALSVAYKAWGVILEDENDDIYEHLWLPCLGLAVTVSFLAALKDVYDKDTEYSRGIFDGKASSDKNALPDFFKRHLNDVNKTSFDIYRLVNNAIRTETLEIFLESAQELGQGAVKKLFDAVGENAPETVKYLFIETAKQKNIFVTNGPGMRPQR